LSILIAATLGCVVVSFFMVLLLYKFVAGALYPAFTVGLMIGAHVALTKLRPAREDPQHLNIQASVVVGGTLSVAIAYFGSGVISPTDLAYSGASMAALALISIALDEVQLAGYRKAADKALVEAERAKLIALEGDLKTADEKLQEALLTTELAYGSHHPQVATIVSAIANLMQRSGRTEAASAMYERAIKVHERLRHSAKELVESLQCYAEHLRQIGKMESGLAISNQAVAESRRVPGLEALAGRCSMTQSRIQAALGKVQAAYESSQAAVRLLEKSLGKNHPETLTAAGLIATHCIALGRMAEAERILRETLLEKERHGQNQDSSYLDLLLDLRTVLKCRGDRGASVAMQKAIEVYRASVGPGYERLEKLHTEMPSHLASGEAELEEFYQALLSKNTNVARRFIERRESLVNHVDGSGWTPLQWAALYDQSELVGTLLALGADHEYGRGTDLPALYVASRWGQKRVLGALFRKDADIEIETADGSRPIHGAVRSGDQLALDMLLSRNAKLDTPNKRGWTTLHEAAFTGDRKLLLQLISKGVDMNLQAGTHRESPLHAAILGGCYATTEMLILNGADVTATKADGVSPLRLAEQRDQKRLQELLKSHLVENSATDNESQAADEAPEEAPDEAPDEVPGEDVKD
jgi:ankyrin repeat protein/organic hydroperoxide reductase OsmC/OhrA